MAERNVDGSATNDVGWMEYRLHHRDSLGSIRLGGRDSSKLGCLPRCNYCSLSNLKKLRRIHRMSLRKLGPKEFQVVQEAAGKASIGRH